jgi:hypothetical protein
MPGVGAEQLSDTQPGARIVSRQIMQRAYGKCNRKLGETYYIEGNGVEWQCEGEPKYQDFWMGKLNYTNVSCRLDC